MWPWQRNGEQPSTLLIRRLLALSSIGHLCLLVFLFVFYQDDSMQCSRDIIAVLLETDVTIVRMPLSKVVHKTVPIIQSSGVKTSAIPAAKVEPPATSISKPLEHNKSQKKQTPDASKTKKDTKPKQKKETPKPKASIAPKVEPKKTEIKKVETPKETVKQPVVAPPKDIATQVSAADQEIMQDENIIYVGQHEYDALEVQREIQQEAQRCWKAPSGVGADIGCEIVVQIEHNGTIRTVTIAESSGVLMYDVQARQAVSRMTFPRGSWGKEIVVYFKQS